MLAYLGLGANLGDTKKTLRNVTVCIAEKMQINILGKSSLYKSDPIDAPGHSYHNCVLMIDTTLSAPSLLKLCFEIEMQFGRIRSYRNAPRLLDIDLLLFNNQQINAPGIIVPHPRLTERAFALIPLIELDMDLVIPGKGYARKYLASINNQKIEREK